MARKDYYNADREKVVRAAMELAKKNLTDDIDQYGVDGRKVHWDEMAKEKWCQVYKTTGTPCSCWMCRGYSYDRKEFKKDTGRIIRESFD